MQRIADRPLTRLQVGQASFTGVWLRMRQTKLPMSFGRHGRALQQRQPGQPTHHHPVAQRRVLTGTHTRGGMASAVSLLVALRDYIRHPGGTPACRSDFSACADRTRAARLQPQPHQGPQQPAPTLVGDDPAWVERLCRTASQSSGGRRLVQAAVERQDAPAASLRDRVHRERPHALRAAPTTTGPPIRPGFDYHSIAAGRARSGYQAGRRRRHDHAVWQCCALPVDDAALLSEYANASSQPRAPPR